MGLSIWEKPIFSRLVSLDHPEVIEAGMVFALETYWPSTDGWSAARIEEELQRLDRFLRMSRVGMESEGRSLSRYQIPDDLADEDTHDHRRGWEDGARDEQR